MNIFKRISKLIEKLNPFGKKEDSRNDSAEKDIQTEISKIEEAQESEREIIAVKEDDSLPQRAEKLTSKQEKLIEQKVKVLDKSKSDKKVQKLKELNRELELLKTNLFLQSRIKFEIKPIEQNLVESISKELIPEIVFEISIAEKQDRKTTIAKNRVTEKAEINKLKSEVTQFSLVNTHKEREAIRKEQERLERERKLDEEYSKHINNSEKELSNNDFKEASNRLKQALKVRPERNEEIQKLLKRVLQTESAYIERKRNEKFTTLINQSQKELSAFNFEKAKSFIKKALSVIPEKENEIQELLKQVSIEKKNYDDKILDEQFGKLVTDSEQALKNLNFDKATQCLDKALSIKSSKRKEIDQLKKKVALAKTNYEQRKLNRKFRELITASNQAIEFFDFEQATAKLNQALAIKPENKKEIQDLLENIKSKEKARKDKNLKFTSLFNLAKKYFHSGELETAIEFYTKAIQLNINNSKCNRRIADTQNKILKLKKREEEQKRKKQLEQELRDKYKSDAKEIVAYYKANGISQFYHYTDRRNLNSILQNNGLFSLREMNNRGIDYHQGSETYELPNYVRLSYTQNHPLLYISKKEGRIRQEKTLNIDLGVAELKQTKFTNVNAARTSTYPTVEVGDDLKFIRDNVKINIVRQRNHFDLSQDEKPYYQAEIMVKDYLSLEYIKNL